MRRYGPTTTRYVLAGFLLIWVSISELGVFVFLYSVLESIIPGLPTIQAQSVVSMAFQPVVLGVGGVFLIATAGFGYYRYGSLANFTIAITKIADSFMGWSLFEEPLLMGRVEHDGLAWRFKYWKGGKIELEQRECPQCGRKLVERVLRRERVHAPNTAVNHGEDKRETAEEAWEDVFSREKVEDHGETLALMCPKCNFSVPGSEDLPEGRDGAQATFEHHVERMKAGNNSGNPFKEYVSRAPERYSDDLGPKDIWDVYILTTDPDDALPFSPQLSNGSFGSESVGEDSTDSSETIDGSKSEVTS